jgi:protease I
MAPQKRALIITTNFGVEEQELTRPLADLTEAGVDVTVESKGGGEIQTVSGDKDWASVVQADTALARAHAEDYDLLVIPGGTVNADTLRGDSDARRLLSDFARDHKSVGAICHGPWLTIDAGVARGKTLTSWKSLHPDLENAGATWVDQEVKVCPANGWTLITSRSPADLPAFDKALVEALSGD